MSLLQTEAPATLAVSRAEVKAHLKIEADDTSEDDVLDRLIAAAVRAAERWLRRQLVTATWQQTLDRFPKRADTPIRLARPPLQEVKSVKYIDEDGVEQTWDAANYTVDTASEPGRILLAYDCTWPTTRIQKNAVTIEFEAGYGDDETDVPADYRLALCYLVGHYHRHRDDAAATPPTVLSLLGDRAWEFARGDG